jgi:hypothetical protein
VLTKRLQVLRLQLENASERSHKQDELLGELLFMSRFADELVDRIGVTALPGPVDLPKYCTSCGKPLP